MCGLFLKTRVSVLTPFASVLVVMSELSGPGWVAAIAVLVLALLFAVSDVLHPDVRTPPTNKTPIIDSVFLTRTPPSEDLTYLSATIMPLAAKAIAPVSLN